MKYEGVATGTLDLDNAPMHHVKITRFYCRGRQNAHCAGTLELIQLCKFYEAKEFAFKNWSCLIIFVLENFRSGKGI